MTKPDLKVLTVEIAKLSLSPGDVLVIKSDEVIQAITRSAEALKHFRQTIPDNKVLILPWDTDLAVLTKADIERAV